ncbi:MAG: hypothetical protein KF858_01290, partial [Candidatus Sumerlaeia bacterium]|nr:hypothetical protein [Candidatus Sumerlaeia bacterium]
RAHRRRLVLSQRRSVQRQPADGRRRLARLRRRFGAPGPSNALATTLGARPPSRTLRRARPTFQRVANGATASVSFFGNPYAFTGRRWEPPSQELRRPSATEQVNHYRLRTFDPSLGRFTTRDPIGIWGDPLNLGNGYTYTGNAPWSWLDPWGLTPWEVDPVGLAEANTRNCPVVAVTCGDYRRGRVPGLPNDLGYLVSGAEQVLLKANAAPITVPGILIGIGGMVYGTGLAILGVHPQPRIELGENDIRFISNPFFLDKDRPFSLGNTTTYSSRRPPDSRAVRYDGRPAHPLATVGDHESGHPYQFEKYGILFFPIYLYDELFSDENRFEKAADDYADYVGSLRDPNSPPCVPRVSPVP